MGKRTKRGAKNGAIRAARFAGAALALWILTLISIQFARAINENIAMARSLSSVQQDIITLRRQKQADERDIKRLLDPRGAMPEIHDRLHLVAPNETIIYLKPHR